MDAALAAGPSLSGIDLTIIIGFLVLVTLVGYVMSRVASRGLDDYFLGGRKIPWWVLGISTSTSNFDMSGTMIIVAVVFALGMRGFLVELRGGVGVSLAFLMVFLGKWLRRSRVMTSAEWMKVRFGTDRQGRAAHLLSAVANVVLSLGMIIYFSKGAGKFLTHFLPFPELGCTAVMVGIGLFYTLMSGLYGVVFTDVVQMILLAITAIYVTVRAFVMRGAVQLAPHFLALGLTVPADLGQSLMQRAPQTWGPMLDVFGVCVMMWLGRSVLEGMGGVGGYTDQRFFAARSEREASLLTLEAIVLALLRWTMVAGLVVMGHQLLARGGPGAALIGADAEQVLPVVLSQMLPVGLKGFIVAGLIAAAMSTFDSTLNAGASYIVKDVYQSYLRPGATGEQLMSASRWATAGLCVAGVAFAALVPNINRIWGLITMGIGAGMFVPLFLRWYWPRFNGYGFAGGTAAGIAAALVVNTGLGWPLHLAFPAVVLSAFAASVIFTLLAAPTDDALLAAFYVQTNPWGLWGRVARQAQQAGLLTAAQERDRLWEKLNDAVALCFAVPFQVCLLLAGMSFVFHAWPQFSFHCAVTALCALGLYFFWYRNLKSAERCQEEEARYASSEEA